MTSSNLAYNELHLGDPTGVPFLFYLVCRVNAYR